MSSLPSLSFGALLRRYRRAAGLTQEELAERARLSRGAIDTLERGARRAPRKETLALLAEALALTASERAVLEAAAHQQGPAISPTSALGAVVQSGVVAAWPLVGRAHELDVLERHLAGNGPPVLLLAGEPGIGKSRLLHEATRRATERGWTVLEGGCQRRSGQEPYAPLVGALEGHIRRASLASLRTDLDGCAWLVRLLPELAETTLVPAPSWALPPEQDRRLMFTAVGRFLANVAGPGGALLVLDDLQWAGADALDLLVSLIRSPGGRPLRVVGAYRTTEFRPEEPLSVTLADLAAAGLATQQPLGPLAPQEATELLSCVLAGGEHPDAEQTEQVLARTGGVPFFLVNCAQALQGGMLASDDKAVPWNVAQSIRQRVAVLPNEAQELLGAAAIIGRQMQRVILLAVSTQLGKDERITLATLEATHQAGLLLEADEETYQFPHDLIREVILTDLSAARRASLHRRVAEALEALPGELPIERLAHHYQRAGHGEKAILYLERAGDRAETMFAHTEAEGYYRAARDLAHGLGNQRHEAAVLEKLGAICKTLARFSQALETLEAAIAIYQASGDIEGHGRVLALVGQVYAIAETPEAGLARIQPFIGPLCTSGLPMSGQAALSIALARLYEDNKQPDASLIASEQAMKLANEAHDARLLGQAKLWRGVALTRLEHWDESVSALEEAIHLLEASRDLENLSVVLTRLGGVYDIRKEYDLALHHYARATEIAERMGDVDMTGYMMMDHAKIAFFLGAWNQARQDCERVERIIQQADTASTSARQQLIRGLLLMVEGQEKAAEQYFNRTLLLVRSDWRIHWLVNVNTLPAERDLLEGNPQAARERLEPLLDGLDQLNESRPWLVEPLGWAYVELGELERAEALVSQEMTRAIAKHLRYDLMKELRVKALLAMRQERRQEAEQALEESLALCQALRTRYDEAKTLYFYGRLHLQQGEPQQARERFEAALAILNQLGERLYAAHVEQALAMLKH